MTKIKTKDPKTAQLSQIIWASKFNHGSLKLESLGIWHEMPLGMPISCRRDPWFRFWLPLQLQPPANVHP